MRGALAIACLAACTATNPAFDPEDVGETEDRADIACTPAAPLELATLDAAAVDCSGRVAIEGMIASQQAGAFTIMECEDECPCAPEGPLLGIRLHPDVPIPVFSACVEVEMDFADDDCTPSRITVFDDEDRVLVHAASWGAKPMPTELVVSEALLQGCACEACDDALEPGSYGVGFETAIDAVGPLRAGEMAEITLADEHGTSSYVAKALSTTVDCACSPLQWSVTRG